MYTLLDRDTIENIIANHKINPGERSLQKTLAREVTELVHGRERRESVERVTGVLFGGGALNDLSSDDVEALAAEIPTVSVQTVVGALVAAGAAASNGDARRLIQGGAVSLDGAKVTEDTDVTKTSLLKKGKNVFVLIRE